MKRLGLAMVMLYLLVCFGCANDRVWVNSSKTNAEAQKDFRECKYDSEKNSFVPFGDGRSPISAGIQEGFQSVSLMKSCMESRGYSSVDKNRPVDFYTQSNNSIVAAFKSNDYNKTIELANKHLERYPYSSDIITVRGVSYREIDRCDLAIKDFEYAVKLINQGIAHEEDSKIMAYTGKALCLAEGGEYDIALALINLCIDTNKSDSASYNNRAFVLIGKGEYDKAIEDCNKSIALEMLSPAPYKNRGLAYLGKGEFDKAIDNFNKSIAIDSTYKKAYIGRGDAYTKLGWNDKAMIDYKRACELGSKAACTNVIP